MSRFVRFTRLLFSFLVGLTAFLPVGGAMAQDPSSLISVQQLDGEIHSAKPPVLIDVREPSEFAQGHLDGATLIPLGQVASRMNEIPKDRPVVVYCRSGHRSGMALELLKAAGYTNVKSLTGGMIAWTSTHSCDPKKLTC